ncbi:hypothetical protein CO666_29125 [Rhizobium chutanense]|uniref:Uncharacterized protein n=1 Tax=Rhizobium chutanense TaxID=2035448 RepID=A0A2A6J3K4_9HYPH|nr:hypothetical protein [Rhizobium chutanense]PDT00779.1 hypothetical protein CO666_29125 [Rhizobium chutanense]
MSEDQFELWLPFCFLDGLCAYCWYWCITSIIFYRKNGFDFSKDFGPKVYWGTYAHDRFLAKPKAKFFIIMPFGVAISSFLTISFALGLMGIIKHCVDCGR